MRLCAKRIIVLGLIASFAALSGCTNRASLAQKELSSAWQLAGPKDPSRGIIGEVDRHSELDPALRLRILKHARRAAELDPKNEEAQYLIVLHAEAVLPAATYDDPVARADCVLPECFIYGERFGSSVPEHHRDVLNRQECCATSAFTHLHEWWREDDILHSPDTRAYPYASASAKALAEWGLRIQQDDRYDTINAWEVFSYELVRHVIPSCPDAELEAERAYWEAFWQEHEEHIRQPKEDSGPRTYCATRPLPWGIIAAAFAARQKDAYGVRQAFQEAVLERPSDDIHVWGGDGGLSRFERLVPLYLKAVGDPEWETWMPAFPEIVRKQPAR